ncbi:unnamed protein product [Rhizophagus irregularis]|nr:unnamed protein product [Rhizophagus irregularis]
MSNKDFKTKNSLLAVCSHQDGQDSSDGYHLKKPTYHHLILIKKWLKEIFKIKRSEKYRKSSSAKEFPILIIRLDPFNILGMLNLGPSIDLVAATDATLEATGTFEFGDDLSLGRSNLICTSLRQKFGLELVGTLDNSFTFGSCKRRTQPRLESSLGGNIGFFVNENDFSILKFHTLLLLNKCL